MNMPIFLKRKSGLILIASSILLLGITFIVFKIHQSDRRFDQRMDDNYKKIQKKHSIENLKANLPKSEKLALSVLTGADKESAEKIFSSLENKISALSTTEAESLNDCINEFVSEFIENNKEGRKPAAQKFLTNIQKYL